MKPKDRLKEMRKNNAVEIEIENYLLALEDLKEIMQERIDVCVYECKTGNECIGCQDILGFIKELEVEK